MDRFIPTEFYFEGNVLAEWLSDGKPHSCVLSTGNDNAFTYRKYGRILHDEVVCYEDVASIFVEMHVTGKHLRSNIFFRRGLNDALDVGVARKVAQDHARNRNVFWP